MPSRRSFGDDRNSDISDAIPTEYSKSKFDAVIRNLGFEFQVTDFQNAETYFSPPP